MSKKIKRRDFMITSAAAGPDHRRVKDRQGKRPSGADDANPQPGQTGGRFVRPTAIISRMAAT